MTDSLPYDDELDYLYHRQAQLEKILILMTLLHVIYFARHIRAQRLGVSS